jgi:hypothetical protein
MQACSLNLLTEKGTFTLRRTKSLGAAADGERGSLSIEVLLTSTSIEM